MIKSFTVGIKHHINLGNYESMEVEAQVTVEIDGNYEKARVEAQQALRDLQNETFLAQHKPAWFANIPTKRVKA